MEKHPGSFVPASARLCQVSVVSFYDAASLHLAATLVGYSSLARPELFGFVWGVPRFALRVLYRLLQ